ncbi:MAG: serine/threonine-protein kinase [Archangium sp.]
MAGASYRLQPGTVLAGRWRIERTLGEGGMGEVLLATELATERKVAIKRLAPTLVAEQSFVSRFLREAKLLAHLEHPNLVGLLGVDVADGVPFIVMKYVEGKTLQELLKERTRLSVRQALPLLDQLASALDYLHARGVVHRDLKPANLIVDSNDRLTVLDFGVSRQRDAARLTSPGYFVGTPLYSAPEQILSDDCDPPVDLYALGLITWHMLVGDHPFGKNVKDPGDIMVLQVNAAPTLASRANAAVPTPVARVIDRALDKEPSKRHPTARAFYEDLVNAFGRDATEGADQQLQRSAGPVPAETVQEEEATSVDTRADVRPTRAAPSHSQVTRAEGVRAQFTPEKPAAKKPPVLAIIGVVALVLLALLAWVLSR